MKKMKNTPRVMALFALLGVFFIYTPKSYADATMYSQDIGTATTTNLNANSDITQQSLGTGLSGVLTQIHYKFQAVATSSSALATMQLTLRECSDNPTNAFSCTLTNFVQNTVTLTYLGTAEYFINLATPYTLDPSKYYYLTFQGSTNLTIQFYGSTANTYANGVCKRDTGGGTFDCTNIADILFDLNGTQTVSDTSYITSLSPANGTTTPTTNVTLSMTYHAAAKNNITSYSFIINDITPTSTSTQLNINGTATTGDNSVTRNITLTSGHIYSVTPYICSSDTTCYSGFPQSSFSVVTNYQTNWNTFFNAYGGTLSSTTATSTADFLGIIPLFGTLLKKIPFGYVEQIFSIWQSQTFTTGNFPLIDLNMQALGMGSTSPIGNILPDLKVSTSTIRQYMPDSVYNGLFALQTVSYYLILALFFWRRGQSLFRKA